jgi:hypothetical protein
MFGWFSVLMIVAFALHSSPLYVVSILGMTVTGLLWISEQAERHDNERS